jgi:hypothetical protein
MKAEVSVEQLLRWRVALAKAEAPPAPNAAQLLELARPWWEQDPERFQRLLQSLDNAELPTGHALAETRHPCAGHPVPVLVVRANELSDSSARVLDASVREGRLHLRFALNAGANVLEETFEVTFVSSASATPLLSADATRLGDREYGLDVEIPAELIEQWEGLKATDLMPFRLILRPDGSHA